MADLGEMKVKVSADLTDLKKKMDEAGGVTQEFGKKAGATFNNLATTVNKGSIPFTNLGTKVSSSLKTITEKLEPYEQKIHSAFHTTFEKATEAGSGISRMAASALGALGPFALLAGALAIGPLTKWIEKLLEADHAQKLFFETIDKGADSYEKAIVDVSRLKQEIGLAKDGFLKKDQVVKDYNESIGKTTGLVKTLDEAEQQLNKNATAYIKFTFLKAVANEANASAAKKTVEAELAKLKPPTEFVSNTQGFFAMLKNGFVHPLNTTAEAMANASSNLVDEANTTKDNIINAANGDANALQLMGDKYSKEAAALAKKFNFNPFSDTKAPKKKRDIETITEVLDKLDRQIGVLSNEELIFKTDKAKEKISAIESTIKHLVDKFKLGAGNGIILDLETRINLINLEERIKDAVRKDRLNPIPIPLPFEILFENNPANEETLKRAKQALQDQIGGSFGKQSESLQTGLNINPFSNASDVDRAKKIAFLTGAGVSESFSKGLGTVKLDEFYNRTKDLLKQLSTSAESTLQNTFAGIGENLGKAIAEGNGEELFGGILGTMAEGLKMFGKALIEYGVAIKITKAAIKNPATAILAGIGLVAFGAALQASIPKFAGGVQNFSGGIALVGEKGPELVNLPTGSDVIPNHELRNRLGGQRDVPYIATVDVHMDRLRIGLKRSDAKAGRIG